MTSFRDHVLGMYRAVARDVSSAYPYCAASLDSDLRILEDSLWGEDVKTFALLEMPKLGKSFDRWLNGADITSVGAVTCSLYGDRVPFLGSVIRPGCTLSELNEVDRNVEPNQALFARQFAYQAKRHDFECSEGDRLRAARTFWSVDQNLRQPRSQVGVTCYTPLGRIAYGEAIDRNARSYVKVQSGAFQEGLGEGATPTLVRLVRMMDEFSARFTPAKELIITDLVPRHGPGAVSDLETGEDKYVLPWSVALEQLFPQRVFCTPNEGLDLPARSLSSVKASARLIAVPKTFDKPRLIASEPVAHQFLQQGLMRWLRANMHWSHKVAINFNSQEPSREAALAASVDGSVATVDLSAASDRLSLWVVESFFRKHPVLLEALLVSRSDHLVDSISGQAGYLRKFAPMGSAVTFPVQSLVYATCCYAAMAVSEGVDLKSPRYRNGLWLKRASGRIRIFGDDLLLPSTAVPYLGLLLEFLELKVNGDKTHYRGHFRESCGMDAYRGFDVTPAYVSQVCPDRKKANVGLGAYIEQSNNAHRKGLWHLAAWMKNQIPTSKKRMVPISNEALACFALFTFCDGTSHRYSRFSDSKHRHEVSGFVPRSRTRRVERDQWTSLLQWMLEQPEPDSDWVSGWDAKRVTVVKRAWCDARCSTLVNPRKKTV